MKRRRYILIAIILLAVAVLLAYVPVTKQLRLRQFDAVSNQMKTLGASLSWELVDGNYLVMIHGEAASDATIKSIVAKLQTLPTGFTLVGPGESRTFWITLSNSNVTDDGINSLCDLELGWLQIDGGSFTEGSIANLSREKKLRGIIMTDVDHPEDFIATLQDAMPRATIMVNGSESSAR